jgi:hypothetical protein
VSEVGFEPTPPKRVVYNALGVDQDNSTQKEQLDFFESHFSIIEKNLAHKNT